MRRLGMALVALGVMVAGIAVWAFASLDTSLYARTLVWMDADTDDWQRFPAREVEASPDPVVFATGSLPAGSLVTVEVAGDDGTSVQSLDEFLADTGSTAFIVLQDDVILT